MMEFEADRMTGLVLTDEIVAPERDVVLEERRMHCDADPSAQLYEAVQATLFTHHPYGTPIIGWGHEIEGLESRGRARLLRALLHAGERHPGRRRRHRRRGGAPPRRAALRQDPPARRGARAPSPARARSRSRAGWSSSTTKRSSSRAGSAAISRPRTAPARPANRRRSTCSPISWAAARRACSIASWSSRTSRRSRRAPITWARRSTRRGSTSTPCRFPASRSPNSTPRSIACLASFIADGVEANALERAKTRLVADAIYAQDSQATLARWYGAALATGQTIRDVQEWPERVEATSARSGARRGAQMARSPPRGHRLSAAGGRSGGLKSRPRPNDHDEALAVEAARRSRKRR